MELQLDVIQRESYIWQSDKVIRQSSKILINSGETINQSDEIANDWLTILFEKSMQDILNYTSETAVIKAVD